MTERFRRPLGDLKRSCEGELAPNPLPWGDRRAGPRRRSPGRQRAIQVARAGEGEGLLNLTREDMLRRSRRSRRLPHLSSGREGSLQVTPAQMNVRKHEQRGAVLPRLPARPEDLRRLRSKLKRFFQRVLSEPDLREDEATPGERDRDLKSLPNRNTRDDQRFCSGEVSVVQAPAGPGGENIGLTDVDPPENKEFLCLAEQTLPGIATEVPLQLRQPKQMNCPRLATLLDPNIYEEAICEPPRLSPIARTQRVLGGRQRDVQLGASVTVF